MIVHAISTLIVMMMTRAAPPLRRRRRWRSRRADMVWGDPTCDRGRRHSLERGRSSPSGTRDPARAARDPRGGACQDAPMAWLRRDAALEDAWQALWTSRLLVWVA